MGSAPVVAPVDEGDAAALARQRFRIGQEVRVVSLNSKGHHTDLLNRTGRVTAAPRRADGRTHKVEFDGLAKPATFQNENLRAVEGSAGVRACGRRRRAPRTGRRDDRCRPRRSAGRPLPRLPPRPPSQAASRSLPTPLPDPLPETALPQKLGGRAACKAIRVVEACGRKRAHTIRGSCAPESCSDDAALEQRWRERWAKRRILSWHPDCLRAPARGFGGVCGQGR